MEIFLSTDYVCLSADVGNPNPNFSICSSLLELENVVDISPETYLTSIQPYLMLLKMKWMK